MNTYVTMFLLVVFVMLLFFGAAWLDDTGVFRGGDDELEEEADESVVSWD